jgi:GDP-D-mannose 3',5'-epimerase
MMDSTKSSIARIFNAYGEFSEYGKTAQVVPALIRKAIKYPDEDFIVWGDGTQTRNLIYIGDCISALLKLEQKAQFPPIKLNIGNPETTTIAQLANTIVSISGKDIKIKYDNTKPIGPISRIPDVALAKEILGWEPKTSLYDGLSRTFEFMREKFLTD